MPNQYTDRTRRRIPAARAYEALAAAGLCNVGQMRYDAQYRRHYLRHLRRYNGEVMLLPGGAKLYYIKGRWYILGYSHDGSDVRKAYRWVCTV